MTNHTLNTCYADAQDVPAQTMQIIKGLLCRATSALEWLDKASAVYRQRQELASMSDSQINDIGLTREQAKHEASRPFWDLP